MKTGGQLIVDSLEANGVDRIFSVPGESYLATFLVAGRVVATRLHRVPVAYRTAPPIVEKVFPTAKQLPANQLKFYIHFSQPMREGRDVFEHIKLLDGRGKEVRDPWRRQELWNADATRLTLWIHPGRVKTGVNLRQDEGPVLLPGRNYTLQIDSKVRGADGQQLAIYRKPFSTSIEDRQRPLPAKWKIGPVRAASLESVRVSFGETLDAALAQRALRLYGPAGKLVPGASQLEQDQTVWAFKPEQPWLNADYRLLVSEDLEDLAGNTPKRLFDTDLRRPQAEPAVLDLILKPAAANHDPETKKGGSP